MKAWLLASILLFVFGALVPLSVAGYSFVEETRLSATIPQGDCASHALRPFSEVERLGATGSVIVRFVNEGEAATGRVCLFDGDGEKRVDTHIAFEGDAAKDVVFETDPGVYTFRAEFAAGGSTATGQGTMNTGWCLSGSEDVHMAFHVGAASSGSSVSGGGCVPGALAVGVLGLVASGGTLLAAKFPHAAALLLYTRIAKPRVLDHGVRTQVYDLVAREPGIHSRMLMRALGVAEGQTAYHLGVLARERLLVSVGLPGARHWFVAGRFRPEQMRAIAMLRDPTRRRMYDAVAASPGASLTDVSSLLGVSKPQGSRAARALERVGIIERHAVGRSLLLRPRRAPGEIYGTAPEASGA